MSCDMHCPYAEQVVQFLVGIGLPVTVKPGVSGFISHVEIVEGELMVSPEATASNVLHEAGHLAIVPARFRSYLSGNIATGLYRAFDEIETLEIPADDPLYRKMMQTGDVEATAWAWAAGKALDIPEREIIRDDEYDGTGDAIRLGLSFGAYVGINGIANADFCAVRKGRPGLPVYPELAFWLQA